MKTEVIMKRSLFGKEISQSSKTEFLSATDLVEAGNSFRRSQGMKPFNLSQYLSGKSATEFIEELELKYGSALEVTRGRTGATWVHPLLFIDIALAISPKLKIEVYEWIYDSLIKFRNDSGDSYKEACAALYMRHSNHKTFPELISKVANYIKDQLGVKDWQSASEIQLKQRDAVHNAIKLYANVLQNTGEIVRLAIEEGKKTIK